MDRLMLIFLFVLCISGIAMFFDYRKQQLKMTKNANDLELGNVQRELAAIKQRLEVLEKIVTDKRYDLDEELASLRSKD